MKFAIYAVVILALAISFVVLVGALLPKKHIASRKIALRHSQAEVFALISDFQSGPTWRRGVQQVTLQNADSSHLRFVEKSKNGSIAMEVREINSAKRIVTEIADKSLPFGGTWIFDVSPTPQGCTLQITERGEIYNPFFRVVSRFVLGYTNTMNTYLEDVANHFHEAAKPEDSEPASL